MSVGQKRWTLTFLLLVILTTFLIAAALPQLTLQPGIPLPEGQETGGDAQSGVIPLVSITFSTLLKAIFGIFLALALGIGLIKLLRGLHWKAALRPLLIGMIVLVVAVGLIAIVMNLKITFHTSAVEYMGPIPQSFTGPPLGLPPVSFTWLAGILLAACVIGMLFWFLRYRIFRAHADAIAREAERALQALQSGEEFKNIILRCFYQMTQVLKAEQGLALEDAMTAREFERLLVARGIPNTPVHKLTQLFEATRYGNFLPGSLLEQEAFECLEAIRSFSHARKVGRK